MRKYRSDELIERDATIHIFESTGVTGGAIHDHDFIEIIYIKSGNATEYVNNDRYEVKKGDLIFINYGSTHRFVATEGFVYINICFQPELLDSGIITPENAFGVLQLTAFDELRQASEGGMISFDEREQPEIEDLLAHMLSEYQGRCVSWQAVLKSYMNILIIHMLRKTAIGGITADEPDIWVEISSYIDEHLGEDLTLSALAKKCFYNPSYFSRVFKEKYRMTLTEYVSRRKLESALTMARESSLSVSQIAERVGFSTTGALYRASLRLTGVSFSELRAQNEPTKYKMTK